MNAIAMLRMRCRRCRRPWGATRQAARTCPYCGHDQTDSSLEVLARALTSPAKARLGWLHGAKGAAV
jgi:hypothetical protein